MLPQDFASYFRHFAGPEKNPPAFSFLTRLHLAGAVGQMLVDALLGECGSAGDPCSFDLAAARALRQLPGLTDNLRYSA
jgi:hypothetical protein